MSIVKEFFPQCDICDWTNPDMLCPNIKELKIHMKLDGWIRKGNKDVCSDCVDNLKIIKEKL